MNKNKNITIIGIIISLIILAGCGNSITGNINSEGTIKIGFIAPLTGDAASYGLTEKNAVEIAVEEINSAGGINGKKLEVIFEDGKCSGKDASTAAQKLIDFDGVKAILGGACSGETLAIAPIAEANKVVVISAYSSSPDVTKAGDFVFRTAPSDSEAGLFTAEYAIKHYNKVGVISENTDYAQGLRKVFKEEFAKAGGELAGDEVFEQDSKDFRTQILKVKAEKPEAILLNPQTGISGGLLAKQVRELGIDLPLIGNFVFSGNDALSGAGDALEGMVFIDVAALKGEKAQIFLEKYKVRFGHMESDYEAGSKYDDVYLIANAIKKVGYDGEAIRDYLYSVKFSGTLGEYYFDENGDINGADLWAEKRIENRKVMQE
jgi:branched-chain amino acid transport system substrate-binding protein